MSDAGRLCDPDDSVLVVIDIQERLATAMPGPELGNFIATTANLLQAARLLRVPVLMTEQYPQGLGKTLDTIRRHLPTESEVLPKTGFSCCSATGFSGKLAELQRKQVILAGMETHICVLQTAFELKQNGFEVFVAQDAVCARSGERTANGLLRMRQAGITISHSESVLFEWLRDAAHPEFKTVSALTKQAARKYTGSPSSFP